MRTRSIRVVSSIPSCVTYKTQLARKATVNHLKFTSLEKTQSPVSGFCYARNRMCQIPLARKATGNHLKFHFPRKTQSPVSGFCYARNRMCQIPLARKATGNHLKFHFPRKTQSPVSGFCHARNRECDAVSFIVRIGVVIGDSHQTEKRACSKDLLAIW